MRRRERDDLARLDDVRMACALILSFTEGKRLPEFVSSPLLQSAVIRQMTVIGEASKNLTEATRSRYPQIQWSDMARLRDRAAHLYWDLDPLLIWKYVQEDVPGLLEILSQPT
jgi:uncharacterized protein with HEPN domain